MQQTQPVDPPSASDSTPSLDTSHEPPLPPAGNDWLCPSWLDRSESESTPNQPQCERPTLAGYELMRELGRGGAGIVYLARHLDSKRRVAVKILHEGALETTAEEQFQEDTAAISRIRHPNVVQILDTGESLGRQFVVFEFVAGPSLGRFLDGKPLPPRNAASLLEMMARALQLAHEQGVIHGDLKPKNVLLSPEENPAGDSGNPTQYTEIWTPKLADFGMARFRQQGSGRALFNNLITTSNYLAPEQLDKEKEVGPPADIYSLGAILYEMLTGRPPVNAADPAEVRTQILTREPIALRQLQPSVPRDLETICLKCLRKEPQRRYASAGDLADDLRRFLEGRRIMARPTNPIAQSLHWAKRKPILALLTAVLGLSIIVHIAGTAFLASANRRERAMRQQAEANRDRALATADAMLDEIGKNPRLHRADLNDVRRKLMARAVPHYLQFVRLTEGDPTQVAQRAHALAMLGFIRFELGELKQSVDDYAAACEIYELLLTRFPEQVAPRREFAVASLQRGKALAQLSRSADAKREFARSASLFEALVNSAEAISDDLVNLIDCKSQLERLRPEGKR